MNKENQSTKVETITVDLTLVKKIMESKRDVLKALAYK